MTALVEEGTATIAYVIKRDPQDLKLHDFAETVPRPTRVEYDILSNSMKDNGQQDPIDVTPEGVILDGRTRWTIALQMGWTEIDTRIVEVDDEQSYIIARAMERRHLSRDQKRALNEAIKGAAKAQSKPVPSTRTRAKTLGVDHSTVVRMDEKSGGANAPTAEPVKVQGADGKTYTKKVAAPKPKPAPVQPAPTVAALSASQTAAALKGYWASFLANVEAPETTNDPAVMDRVQKYIDVLDEAFKSI